MSAVKKQAAKAGNTDVEIPGVRHGFSASLSRLRALYYEALREVAIAAVGDHKPGFDGKPPELSGEPQPGDNPQLTIVRNVREHPLDLMLHKKQIPAELWTAGDRFRADLEMSRISPFSGHEVLNIYTEVAPPEVKKIEVTDKDGNVVRDKDGEALMMAGPATFHPKKARGSFTWNDVKPDVMDAMDRVKQAKRAVEAACGVHHAIIAEKICGDRFTIREVSEGDAQGRNLYGNRKKVGRHFREALQALQDHYGGRSARRRILSGHVFDLAGEDGDE